jgi:hypothetical protein
MEKVKASCDASIPTITPRRIGPVAPGRARWYRQDAKETRMCPNFLRFHKVTYCQIAA